MQHALLLTGSRDTLLRLSSFIVPQFYYVHQKTNNMRAVTVSWVRRHRARMMVVQKGMRYTPLGHGGAVPQPDEARRTAWS